MFTWYSLNGLQVQLELRAQTPADNGNGVNNGAEAGEDPTDGMEETGYAL
jgi:hypothetical protein